MSRTPTNGVISRIVRLYKSENARLFDHISPISTTASLFNGTMHFFYENMALHESIMDWSKAYHWHCKVQLHKQIVLISKFLILITDLPWVSWFYELAMACLGPYRFAIQTEATPVMRHFEFETAIEKELNDLVIVRVSRQHERRYVGRELRSLNALAYQAGPLTSRSHDLFHTNVLGMVNDKFHYMYFLLADGI